MKISPQTDGLIDIDATQAQLDKIVADHGGDAKDLSTRADILQLFKDSLQTGRERAEKLLEEDGIGILCAIRLSYLEDQLITLIHRFAINHVYRVDNPTASERLAIVAVGGYGRATLAPFSDIDLLFLLPYKQTPWGESVVEYILYMLWDMGQKVGHATRTLDECVRLSRSDMTIRTSILEARFIDGEKPLYEGLIDKFDKEVMKNTSADFIAAKLGERDSRHEQQGNSRYMVEPNVKEGKGGLRDIQTLFWIGQYAYRVRKGKELVDADVFSAEEYARFKKANNHLWTVRCHLHFLTGRPEERVSFDVQRELSEKMGYKSRPGQNSVERFMKHYFLVAKEVGELTRVFCAALEEDFGRSAPGINRFLNAIPFRRRKIRNADGFCIDHGRLSVENEEVISQNPVNILRIFEVADQENLLLHPDAMQAIHHNLRLIDNDMRNDPKANATFLRILTSRRDPESVLRRMNESGILGRFIPEFGRIVAMMQFNMYHHYTVDEHLLRAVGILSEIEKQELGDEHPLAHELVPKIKDRVVLYVAVFLHDIAKGRPERHSPAGAQVARELCPRLGLTDEQTEQVAWLIMEHLTMSQVSQSRDLSDRKTILDFCNVVQTMEQMRMLLILTIADIKAVGPGVWNGWKGQLLRTLYSEVEPILTGGHSQQSRDSRVARMKEKVADRLSAWSETEIAAYLDLHYSAYWLRTDVDSAVAHAELIYEADKKKHKVATAIKTYEFEGITEITILAPDHPRLLSMIAGACSAAGGNIVDAMIFTTTDGRALDTILIEREFLEDHDERRRANRIVDLLVQVLKGETRLPALVQQKEGHKRRLQTFRPTTKVTVNNEISNQATVVEVEGLDRPGLLSALTRTISALNLDIASAHITTYGERVVDAFYLTDLTGAKISNPARKDIISARLMEVLKGKLKERPTAPEE
ncbi:UTP--GlnB (protein PII) uridylyltransferase, GlnD [Cohaesibacter sp. ES.047]|uniref:[protein-PII] uridylyltransferase n=1 Tax=Cohaesibacter sp. ES.047 TaxID=1798205 RepID=UPI000BB88E26|nr:[protein-PII] uridylyltransferase [Cohaesibacter sp. ES.047]SNY90377.1 UTP--GlnB (protein PII) uridylyltransferase, GlnD [Cohaesibacter sp. ES.047]